MHQRRSGLTVDRTSPPVVRWVVIRVAVQLTFGIGTSWLVWWAPVTLVYVLHTSVTNVYRKN